MLNQIQAILERSPDQKAKTIASLLGADRSIVNRLLHDNNDIFVQVPLEFTWSLADLQIDLGSRHWLTADLFEDAVLAAGSPIASASPRVRLVVGEDCKILIDALARSI
jgi:hypothetical protein